MGTIWRKRVDMRNQGYQMPNCVKKSTYRCSYLPDREWDLPYWEWSIDLDTKFSYVPVSHNDFPHILASLSFSSSNLPSPKNMKWVIHVYLSMPWSWVNTEYSIHQVLHYPMIDFLPLPASLSSLGSPCCTQLATFPRSGVWSMNRVSAPVCDFLSIYHLQTDHLQAVLHSEFIMAFKCISKLARSWPPSESPNLLDYSLQVRTIHGVQTYSITASKCITEFTQSRPPSASPNLFDHGLQVRIINGLQTLSITASKCIPLFTRSRAICASWNLLIHCLQVHLSDNSISASKCISKLAQSRPSTSLNSHNHRLPVGLLDLSMSISRYSYDYTREYISSQDWL